MRDALTPLVTILQQLSESQITSAQARSRLEQLDWTSLEEVAGLFHNLDHFLSDEDIRAKDEEYSLIQQQALTRAIAALRVEDFEAVESISFLD